MSFNLSKESSDQNMIALLAPVNAAIDGPEDQRTYLCIPTDQRRNISNSQCSRVVRALPLSQWLMVTRAPLKRKHGRLNGHESQLQQGGWQSYLSPHLLPHTPRRSGRAVFLSTPSTPLRAGTQCGGDGRRSGATQRDAVAHGRRGD